MYISIDLGGTNTRVASSTDLKSISEQIKVETLQNVVLEKNLIRECIEEFSAGEEIKGICIGVPGFVKKDEKKLGKIVNIPSFSNLSYTEVVGALVSEDNILAENDATLASLGEAVLGAGKDYEVVAYLTLSTGVGGARISGKRIDPHQNYAEPGHMIIEEDGRECELCGQKGCLSAYTSGTSFESVYGVKPSDCEDQDIWNRYAEKLSLGIINIMADWGPDVIVLGGSISKKFENFFKKPLLEELSQQKFFEVPPIIRAELGDNSGIIGGFILLEQSGF